MSWENGIFQMFFLVLILIMVYTVTVGYSNILRLAFELQAIIIQMNQHHFTLVTLKNNDIQIFFRGASTLNVCILTQGRVSMVIVASCSCQPGGFIFMIDEGLTRACFLLEVPGFPSGSFGCSPIIQHMLSWNYMRKKVPK